MSRRFGGFNRPAWGFFTVESTEAAGLRLTRMGVSMSDEQTTEAAEAEPKETPAQEIDWKAMARKHEERSKAANAELEELRKRAARLDELEEAQKSEAEKLAEKVAKAEAKAAELEKQVAAKDREVLAQTIANTKGVPARYVFGETEDEMNASADQFLEDVKGIAPERPSGVVPSAGTGDPKAKFDTVADARARAAAKYGVQN